MLETIYRLEKLYIQLYMAGDFEYAEMYRQKMELLKLMRKKQLNKK